METKVAKILSATELVLGAGSAQGVKRGDEFIIYSLGEDIYDPETKEPLGRLETVKGRVQVIHVMEKMCRAQTRTHTRTRTRTIQPAWNSIAAMLQPREETYEEEIPTLLKVDPSREEFEEDFTVREGDHARRAI